MLRVLRTHHRWGVSGTVITNGLVALKSLAEFLGLQPYADPSWWKEHIGSSTATAAANRGNKFGGSWTSFKKRGSSSTQEEEEEAAAAEAAAAKAVAVAQHPRLGRLQDLARQHMWRTRQGDTKPMPPQKFLPPCRVRDEAILSEHRSTEIEARGGASDARHEFVFVLKRSAGVLINILASDF